MRVRRQPHLTLDDHFRAVATGTPLRDGHETDRAGLTLVDACRALLAAAPSQPVADAIFSRVDRAGLVDAVAAMERLARSPEDRARDLILTRRGASLPPAAAGHALTFTPPMPASRSSTPSTRCGAPPASDA